LSQSTLKALSNVGVARFPVAASQQLSAGVVEKQPLAEGTLPNGRRADCCGLPTVRGSSSTVGASSPSAARTSDTRGTATAG
jgi:hypothetical protein